MGFEPGPSKEGSWMMAQSNLVVVGIDVAKDKVDACIRSLSLRWTSPSTAQDRRKLIAWLRKHKVGKAVMEASGGYERDWAKALREADIEVRIVDPKRVRSFARSAGRLAKNDAIDAEMIAWFAETFGEVPGQAYDAAREKLSQIVNARQGLLDLQTKLQNRGEHAGPEPVQKMHARLLKKIAVEVAKLEAVIAAMIKATPHFAELAEIIESVPGLARTTSAGLVAAMPELGQVSNKIAPALLGAAPYDDDSGPTAGRTPHQGRTPQGPQSLLHGLSRGRDPAQPRAQGLLSSPDRQGQGAEGCARRLHAQAHRHPQHHDRATPEMGSQSLRAGLTSAPPRSASGQAPARPKDR
jgi:transposase